MKSLRLALLLASAVLLWACSTTKDMAAWEFYDGCMLDNVYFSGVVFCGEQRLNSHCERDRGAPACGQAGMAAKAYASYLADQIDNRKLTDGEARRKWAQFELRLPEEQIRISREAVAAAAPPPAPSPAPVPPPAARRRR
jgi:hypothetical protein